MCITRKDMCLIFADMVDNLPYKAFEISNDFTLEVMVMLSTKGGVDFCVCVNFSKKGLQFNLVSPVSYHKIKAFLIEEPTKHKVKVPYHNGLTYLDLIEFLKDYLDNKEQHIDYSIKHKPIVKSIVSNYYNDDYFNVVTTDDNINQLFVENNKDTELIFNT